MPHLAAIVGAGVVVAGVCIAVNHALDERRRQREEDREFEAAIAASLYEFEQDSQRRQTQVDREQRAIASAVARSAESEGNEGTLRRRRRTSDFASRSTAHHDSNDLIEMTERMYLGHGHESAAPPLVDLFDAGPSSRASDPTYFSPPWTTVPSPWDANLDAVASPSHRATGIHEKPSMQADTRPSRVTSPLSDSLGRDGSGSGSQHAVTHTTGKAESDAGTDTTGVLISRPSSPLVVHDSFSSPTSATPRIISLPVSPSFSAVSFTRAREIQPASDRTASGEIDSAWSDLGEDSSEDEAESVAKGTDSEESARREEERQQRMRYLSRLDRGNTPYASLV